MLNIKVSNLVVGPEVMAPLAAAMDLIDGQLVEDAELVALLKLGHEPLALGQLLRSDIEKPHGALGVGHILKGRFLSLIANEQDLRSETKISLFSGLNRTLFKVHQCGV